MIVTFDTNAYRNIVSRSTLNEAKNKILEIQELECKKGITPMMCTTVAMELLTHLADDPNAQSYKSCLTASQVMYIHCGNASEFRLLPLPETQIAKEYFNIENQKFIDTQTAIGQILFAISQSPSEETVKKHSKEIAMIKQFIADAEQTLSMGIEEMCKSLDSTFSNWTLFATDSVNRKKYLDYINSESFQITTASAYLYALAIKLQEQGYTIDLTEEQVTKQIQTYIQSYQTSLNFRAWFFSQLVNGGFDLTAKSRTNFLWDELILHFIGHKCNGEEILLVTSDKKMNDAAKRVNSKALIKTYEEYLDYIKD